MNELQQMSGVEEGGDGQTARDLRQQFPNKPNRLLLGTI